MSGWPDSIRGINALPDEQKLAIYRTLIPERMFTEYGLDRETLTVDEQPVVQFRCPKGSRAFELAVRRRASDRDPMLFLNMADTFNNRLMVLLVVINDPDAPRFDTDYDAEGNRTQFGTVSRNIGEEIAAMNAGLAPGQVRAGLRWFRQLTPLFESFVASIGQDMYFMEPLAYHNAILCERIGFSYERGLQEMRRIDRQFQPGGDLYAKLTPRNPFRCPEAWQSVRGRSWAIHDGILGHPYTGVQMYKRLGVDAQVRTFSGEYW
jgi:hypothetical protein